MFWRVAGGADGHALAEEPYWRGGQEGWRGGEEVVGGQEEGQGVGAEEERGG